MASIRSRKGKDGKIRYQAQVRIKGQPPKVATFLRRTDAKIWAQKTEIELREKKHFEDAERERKTFGDLVERFVEDDLSERIERDQGRLEAQLRWWEDQLGESTLLSEITPAKVSAARDRLKRGNSLSGRKPSPATIKRYLSILSRAFSVAVKDWYWLDENPCSKVSRPKEPRGRVRFLDADEKERLLEACRNSHNEGLYCLVLAALTTGARQGELLNLRWRNLDFTRGSAIIENSKNGERRSVPLVGSLVEELRKRSRLRHLKNDLIFINLDGRPCFPRDAWERAVKEARLENFKFHDLRHTAASYLAMSGATLAEIAEILGHKTLQMVKRYAHLTDSHSHKVAARMAELFL